MKFQFVQNSYYSVIFSDKGTLCNIPRGREIHTKIFETKREVLTTNKYILLHLFPDKCTLIKFQLHNDFL